MNTDEDIRIGILCKNNKPVFTEVAERLRNTGYTVRFFHARSELPSNQIDDLSLIVNKQVFPLQCTVPLRRLPRQLTGSEEMLRFQLGTTDEPYLNKPSSDTIVSEFETAGLA